MRLIVRGVGATVTLTTLHPWSTVKDTKDILQDLLKIPAPRQRLVFRGEELKNNNRRLLEWDIAEGSTLLLISLGPQELEDPIRPLYSIEPPGFSALVEQAKQGIAKGLIGKLTIDGTGGTYFLRNAQKQEVLVFKPADEEAFGPNNPRGHIGRMGQQSFRPGVLSGEGHLREIAAYLLDHDQFAGVPQTARMEVACRVLGNSALASPFQNTKKANIRTKVGSMQAFVSSDDVAANFSESLFPVHEVHKIAILDIRLVNTDRNDANILVVNRLKPGTSRGSTNPNKHVFLVPIDHAFCLPDTLEIAWADWAWLGWPQAKRPVDDATKEYVKNIDIEQDIELLRSQLFIREPCLRLMRITHMLLQRAIARGCSLFQIGSIICRKDIDEPSQLEVMCHQATAFSQAIVRQAPARSLYRKWRTDEPAVDRNGEQSDGKSSSAPFASCLDNSNNDNNTSNNTSAHLSSASNTSNFLALPPLLPSRTSGSRKEEKEAASSSANTPHCPPLHTPRSSSPSFPPPSPSSWSNTPPNSWLPPLARSRTPSANIANPLPHAQLTSIEEDEIIDIWNSLPLLPTRRSNSSPSSPPSLPAQGPTPLSTRTASTPRAQKSKGKKVPLIPRLPKGAIPEPSDTAAATFLPPMHPPAPSASTPAASSMSSNPLPYVSPLSLLSRVSQKQQKKQQQQAHSLSISLDVPSATSFPTSPSSVSPLGLQSRSPKASHSHIPPPRSISSDPPSSSPSGFMSFPVCNPPMLPTSPPPSFASYPLPALPSSPPSSFISFPVNVDVDCLPACSSSPSLSSTITVPSLSVALPSEVNNPSRHEMTCSPEVLAPCTFSPRKQSGSANNKNGSAPSPAKRLEITSLSVDTGNTFATDINNNGTHSHNGNTAKRSLYVNTSPVVDKGNGRIYNPRSGSLKLLSGSSPKLKKSLMKRHEEAVEEDLSSNDVKIKIIGEDSNAQRATKLSTTISGTLRRFGSKMENTERIIRETTAVVAKQIADISSDTAIFISGSANSDLSPQKPWTMKMNDFDENSIPKNHNTDSKGSAKPKRFCGHATGSPDGLLCVSDGISVLGNCGNCERDNFGIEKIEVVKNKHESAFLLSGPLPLFSAKKSSGERYSSSTGRSSREISEDAIRKEALRSDGEKNSTVKDNHVSQFVARKHSDFGHDKENSHAVNFDSAMSTGVVHGDFEAALLSEVPPAIKCTETDSMCLPPTHPLHASEHVGVAGVASKQAAKFAAGGLPGLDRPLELKRAMSYSFSVNVHPTGFAAGSKSPTKMVTKSLDNDDWSVPPPSSCDVNPLSPTAASDELFFSCLAKLIDTVLDFTSTKHSPG